MADMGIPVIHLLYMKGLVGRYGLPWDPKPLPEVGQGEIYARLVEDHPLFTGMAGLYFVIVILWFTGWKVIASRK